MLRVVARGLTAAASRASPSVRSVQCRPFAVMRVVRMESRACPAALTPFAPACVAAVASRGYAKKASKSGKGKQEDADEEVVEVDVDALLDTTPTKELMDAAIEHLKIEYVRLRTRATPALLDGIKVQSAEMETSLKNVAQITVKDAFTILVNVFETTNVDAVESALRDAGIGLTTTREGKLIRASIPKLTHEYRQTLVKRAKDLGEACKSSIKRARQKGIDGSRKAAKLVSTDDTKRFEKELQNLTDAANKTTDDLIAAKSKEILTV